MSFITEISQDQFVEKVVEQSKKTPVLVDFWAPWCGPCKMISPILNQIAEERDITIAKVNTDMNPLSMGKFGFRGIPALVLFHNGQAVDQMTGARPKPMFDQWLGKYMD